jgi:hypothetical protein
MRKGIVFLALLWPILAGAEIYKWTDASGKLHYSQNPPAGVTKFDKVTPPPPPLPPNEALEQIHRTIEETDKSAEDQAQAKAGGGASPPR